FSCQNQAVAHASDRLHDMGSQFLAQSADIYLDCVALDLGSELIQPLFKLGLRKQSAGSPFECVEQCPFTGSQVEWRACTPNSAIRPNEAQLALLSVRVGDTTVDPFHG